MSSSTNTNDISSKPIKINKWESNALKNTLNDACKKYFKETLHYTEDYSVMNRRLCIALIACLFSLYALVYDWFNPFPKSRSVLIVCTVSYFIIIGILTFYMQFIESGRFFTGKLIDKTGIDPAQKCKIISKLKKYDDIYNLTLEYHDGKNTSTSSVEVLKKSVGNYFDENGVLCYDKYINDLKKIYDHARSNARKVK
ncbi:unnamed protein product [Rotaria magnacalcarata]|uniref:Signal peptidase complex subunit 2 n=2 Tax=Rotaria magnacalcarata TaxID=392030 RepID=A0A819BYV0_9BILA|nr:unnamed protein product [Rotaria magnacalcarata]CAF3804244.1 unnamed protein product [Rotaria magnacalcarata]